MKHEPSPFQSQRLSRPTLGKVGCPTGPPITLQEAPGVRLPLRLLSRDDHTRREARCDESPPIISPDIGHPLGGTVSKPGPRSLARILRRIALIAPSPWVGARLLERAACTAVLRQAAPVHLYEQVRVDRESPVALEPLV